MRKYIDAFTIKRYTGIFIILAVVTVFSLMVNVTIAYLGDKKDKTNTVQVGYADVSIAETFEEPSTLEMTNTIDKKVQIKNTGTVPAFVRVYAEFADSSIAEHAKVKYGTETDEICSWSEFKTKLKNGEIQSKSKWKYVDAGDLAGYFYYTEALSYGEETTQPLFESVTIDYRKYKDDGNGTQVPDTDDSNIDRIQPVEMIIYSELVQTVDTGKTTVKMVDENNNPIMTTDDPTKQIESSVYGYDFDKTIASGDKDNWQDAWKRFLNKNTAREQSEVSQQAQ